MTTPQLLIIHHDADGTAARSIQAQLSAQEGVVCVNARATAWHQIATGLSQVQAVAILMNATGLSQYQKQAIGLALARQAQVEQAGRTFPIVPVLLPGAELAPAFLFKEKWVDLRNDLMTSQGLAQLAKSTLGKSNTRPIAVLVDHCPYRGLRPYREEDAAFFFGREIVIDQLVAAVQNESLVTLVGPAESGKTSTVQAGLIPRLRHQTSVDSWWRVVTIDVSRQPSEQLARALTREIRAGRDTAEPRKPGRPLPRQHAAPADIVANLQAEDEGTSRLLVVVDQFEMLFIRTPENERARFIATLLTAVDRLPALSLMVVLRAEYYGLAMTSDESLAPLLKKCTIILDKLNKVEARQIITKPARLVTVGFELSLVDHLVESRDNLSLLSFSLQALWSNHQGGLLNWTCLEEIGGLDGAINYRAEQIFNNLSIYQQHRLRQIFGRLIAVDETGAARICRVCLAHIDPQGNLPDLEMLLRPWLAGNLLVITRDEVVGEDNVEIASEQVLVKWIRLRAWIDEEREFLLWHRRLSTALAAKEQPGRTAHPILRPPLPAESERWLRERSAALSATERAYIQQTIVQHRRGRRTRWGIGLAAFFLLAFVIAGIFLRQYRTISQVTLQRDLAVTTQAETDLARQAAKMREATAEARREFAEQQGQQALARQLAVQSRVMLDNVNVDVVPGTLLSIESLRRAPLLEAEQALRHGMRQLLRPTARFPHQGQVWSAIFSPAGHRLATRSGKEVQLWNAETGAEITRLVHNLTVNDMIFSPDSRWLVTTGLGHTAHVWDVSSGREVGRLRHDDRLWAALFSTDGQWLATRSDRAAYVWRLTSDTAAGMAMISATRAETVTAEISLALKRLNKGEPPAETRRAVIGRGFVRVAHGDVILTMALSPDGRWLVTGGVDRIARVWEVATGLEVARLEHGGVVRAVAFSPDGRLLVTGSADRMSRLWSFEADADAITIDADWPIGQAVKLMHPDDVNIVAFSHDGRWLATGSVDNSVRVWLVTPSTSPEGLSARQVAQVKHRERVQAVAFSPDNRWIATASNDGTARVWLTTTGRQVAQMGHSDKVNDVAFSPDGRHLITAGSDRLAQLWEATIGYEVAQMEHDDWVLDVAFSPGSANNKAEYVLAARSRQTAKVWQAVTGREIAQLDHQRFVNAIAFSSDGRHLATGSYRIAQVWETATGHEVARLAPEGLVRSLAYSSEGGGRFLATAGLEKVAYLWDITTGQEAARLAHDDWVNAVAFSPDGRWIATASNDHTARIWEVTTGFEIARMTHDSIVNDVAFSPDGQWLATASGDRTARIWIARSVREVARMIHQGGVLEIAFSPDGQWLASRSGKQVQIWETISGKNLAEMKHFGTVAAMVFSPNSRTLATASGDRLVRIWDVTTGEEIGRLVHDYWVNAVAYSPDGRWLATGSADHMARVWFLDQNDLVEEACRRLPRNLTPEEWAQNLGDEPYRSTCPNLPAAM